MNDLDPVIDEMIGSEMKEAKHPAQRAFLERLCHSPDTLLRLLYAKRIAAEELERKRCQIDGDRSIELGLVSTANIHKLASVEQLETRMHHIVRRIRQLEQDTRPSERPASQVA